MGRLVPAVARRCAMTIIARFIASRVSGRERNREELWPASEKGAQKLRHAGRYSFLINGCKLQGS